ncbi:hypothetical protein A8U91_02058 [Halomonas elongata]|uniref:Tripartite tricarboxylate transporter TctB family protein n=1 Tax=Halomonas elongata TaxID=2746 RepID=A0A1B8P636_HALEL|nr:hypothetical protein [Halomonas elongata]OBX37680.1 hypothetical protein A8U91_02058 [Halomonas elongata]
MRVTADRLLGFVLLGLAAFVAVQALQWQIPFSYEPVGPRAFPWGWPCCCPSWPWCW